MYVKLVPKIMPKTCKRKYLHLYKVRKIFFLPYKHPPNQKNEQGRGTILYKQFGLRPNENWERKLKPLYGDKSFSKSNAISWKRYIKVLLSKLFSDPSLQKNSSTPMGYPKPKLKEGSPKRHQR